MERRVKKKGYRKKQNDMDKEGKESFVELFEKRPIEAGEIKEVWEE